MNVSAISQALSSLCRRCCCCCCLCQIYLHCSISTDCILVISLPPSALLYRPPPSPAHFACSTSHLSYLLLLIVSEDIIAIQRQPSPPPPLPPLHSLLHSFTHSLQKRKNIHYTANGRVKCCTQRSIQLKTKQREKERQYKKQALSAHTHTHTNQNTPSGVMRTPLTFTALLGGPRERQPM